MDGISNKIVKKYINFCDNAEKLAIKWKNNFVANVEQLTIKKVALIAIGTYGVSLLFRIPNKMRVLACVLTNLSYIIILTFRDTFPIKWPLRIEAPPKDPKKLREQIKFDQLIDYGITLESIEQYESDIEEGNFDSVRKFIDTIINSEFLMKTLVSSKLLIWLLVQIEKLVDKKELSDELCTKIHNTLSKYGYFATNEKFALFNSAEKNGKKIKINKLAILLASSYARTLHYSDFADGKKEEIGISGCSDKAILQFKTFLVTRTVNEGLSFEVLADLMTISKIFLLPEMEKAVVKRFEEFNTDDITTEAALNKYLNLIEKYNDKIADRQICQTLAGKGISSYLKATYQSTKPFKLSEGLYSLPINALRHLGRKDALGKFLVELVNTISLPSNFNKNHIDAFRLLKHQIDPEIFQRITNLVFNFRNTGDKATFDEENLRAFFSEFSQVKTVYLAPTISGDNAEISVDVIEKFRQTFSNIKVVLLVDQSVLPPKEPKVTFHLKESYEGRKFVNLLLNTDIVGFFHPTTLVCKMDSTHYGSLIDKYPHFQINVSRGWDWFYTISLPKPD